MRPLRRGLALSDLARLSACVSALVGAAALAGCTGGGERVYGFHAATGETASFDVSGRSSGMSRTQQDAIIAQAIVAHEMRRP
jgi:hypothetical protein